MSPMPYVRPTHDPDIMPTLIAGKRIHLAGAHVGCPFQGPVARRPSHEPQA